MMKKMTVLFMAAFITIAANAQFYAQGGFNLANITNTSDGQTEKNNWLPAYNVGLMGRFGISGSFDLETGVLFTGKGAKAETYFNNGADYVKAKFNPHYFEVPLNAVVKIPLDVKAKSNIFFHAGPYIAAGVGGKSTINSKIGQLQSTFSRDIKFSSDDPTTGSEEGAAYDRLKRFDFGANIGAGIDFGKLLLKANYGFGFSKINSTQTDNGTNDKNKFRTFSISAGIPIGK
jgi:hypothetical protein